MQFLTLYFVTIATFVALDGLWLGVVAPKFYRRHLGQLMAERANFLAAGVFYIVFMAGLVFFVLQPALHEGSWSAALLRGAFFGLVTYATFDLTNQAILKKWPWVVTTVDIAWGTFITGAVSTVAFLIARTWFI